MNVNVQTVSRTKPAPAFNLVPNAHIIRSDTEAVEVAQALAAEFAVEAAARDRSARSGRGPVRGRAPDRSETSSRKTSDSVRRRTANSMASRATA